MRIVANGFFAALVLAAASGCPAEGAQQNGVVEGDADVVDPDGGGSDDAPGDPGMDPTDDPPPDPTDEPDPTPTPRTEVPEELVGTWQAGVIDFALWENYTEGYYAGRNAIPSREAMVLEANGDAKFYRYEFAFTLYEELIDCEGTVAFHGDGTFTFYPTRGRKRFHDFSHSERHTDRALTAEELVAPKLAGTRAYRYVAGATPATLTITVPSSAPYNWYKQE